MREFNTSGPCDPTQHYTVMREALVAEGRRLVEKGRYFTTWQQIAPKFFHTPLNRAPLPLPKR